MKSLPLKYWNVHNFLSCYLFYPVWRCFAKTQTEAQQNLKVIRKVELEEIYPLLQ